MKLTEKTDCMLWKINIRENQENNKLVWKETLKEKEWK